jgi:hypothetical protein
MPSALVDEVRALIAAREEAKRPLTSLERAMLTASITPRRNTPDLVDELEAAITQGRRVLLGDPPPGADPAYVAAHRRTAATRLLAAARAVLDHDPARESLEDYDPTANLPDERLRPARADVDG